MLGRDASTGLSIARFLRATFSEPTRIPGSSSAVS
jgi:hypothetical protein